MYIAKKLGGQGFLRHFSRDIATDAAENMVLEGRLQHPLGISEFSLMYSVLKYSERPRSMRVLLG